MERAVLRVTYDRDAETQAIKVILSASPSTGGRSRQRANNVWDTIEEFEGAISDFLLEELPENEPAP